MADYSFIRLEKEPPIALLTLDRPEVLNAWHRPMREEILAALAELEADKTVRAIVITGAGRRAFCAGQDLNEAKDFDPDRAEEWIGEWKRLYGALRSLTKPLVVALNGLAAGSAFQFVLLADIRVGHSGVRLGQPEIKAGIASILGPWIMREVLGLSRTVELTLTGRLMSAAEAERSGVLHHLVPQAEVLARAKAIARDLAEQPPVALALDKQWFRELTQEGFEAAFAAALAYHRRSYESGEPQRLSAAFLAARGKR